MTIQVTQVSGAGQGTPVYQSFPYAIQFYCQNDGVPEDGIQVDLQVRPGSNGAQGYFSTGSPEVTYISLTSGLDGFTNIAGMYANGIEGDWSVDIFLWIPYSGPTTFSMTNNAPSGAAVPTNVSVSGGNNQTVAPSTALPISIKATVTDQYGAAVGAGTNVTATAPTTGASGVFASTGTNTKTVATNGSGVADFGTFTTNATDGAFFVNLTSGSLSPSKAQVTIKTPTSEVCTPPSKMTQYQGQVSWTNPERWWTGAAQSGTYCYLSVDGTNTPAQSVLGFTFDAAQLALIKDLAEITSITLAFSRYQTKSGTYYPGGAAFIAYMNLADSGLLTTTRQCGLGLENSWQDFTYTWSAFTNTGNAGNKLYGFEIKGSNLQAIIQYTTSGASANVAGQFRCNGATLVICYINPEGGEEQSLQLCIL